ncbi:hypothetical protein MPSI1_000538 [Malassezia psittaci]|uniref:Uncharacterized protein n=1 Tax=Malassezia psittaci TaxID=1821823 RepID=A0AAF0F2V9_9BASI|nr:hypothetical protein MPSI1_000538 [Malassezia psittaci]
MSRPEEVGIVDSMHGVMEPRTPDLGDVSTSESENEDEPSYMEEDVSIGKIASSPVPGSPEPAPEVRYALAKHMRVQHNTTTQAQGAREIEDTRDSQGVNASARRLEDDSPEILDFEQRKGPTTGTHTSTLANAQRAASAIHLDSPSEEAQEQEVILQRAQKLGNESRKRTINEADEDFEDDNQILDEEGSVRVLRNYLVEKAKYRANWRAREQLHSQIQDLYHHEEQLAESCRATLNQLLEQRYGDDYLRFTQSDLPSSTASHTT